MHGRKKNRWTVLLQDSEGNMAERTIEAYWDGTKDWVKEVVKNAAEAMSICDARALGKKLGFAAVSVEYEGKVD